MNTSLESKALAIAMLAASVSLGASLLAAIPIKHFAGAAPLAENAATGPEPQVAETPEQIAKGRDNFVMSCVECHGDDAHGDEGPDLHNLAISNARISLASSLPSCTWERHFPAKLYCAAIRTARRLHTNVFW